MNNHRLLAGLLGATLLSGGVRAAGNVERVLSLEELFETAETNSAQLRPYFTAELEARRAEAEARSGRLPDISASLSIALTYSPVRPHAIFPKWRTLRHTLRRTLRLLTP